MDHLFGSKMYKKKNKILAVYRYSLGRFTNRLPFRRILKLTLAFALHEYKKLR